MGLEYNPVVSELLPTANWIAAPETDTLPLVSFGTSSDRIFTPEGNRAYYVSIAKGIKGTNLSPYISFSYSQFNKKILVPWGVNISVSEEWDVLPMFDGVNGHLLVTRKWASTNLTLMINDLDEPVWGISFGWGVK
jgi:hypothetical protein